MARAILLSGSYMLYARHGMAPDEGHFLPARMEMPNMSSRMDNLRAAVLRPQLARIDDAIGRWNARYAAVALVLAGSDRVVLPRRPIAESFVGSSIQFRVPGISADGARGFVGAAARMGVELKWFGSAEPVGFTSAHQIWRYMDPQSLPRTDAILAGLFDMQLPLTFSLAYCDHIARILLQCAAELTATEST